MAAINMYSHSLLEEGWLRGYRFDTTKLTLVAEAAPIKVSSGHIHYEWRHLLSKLSWRDSEHYQSSCEIEHSCPHALIKIVPGDIKVYEAVQMSFRFWRQIRIAPPVCRSFVAGRESAPGA